jgi:hypothetical protein
MRLAILLVVMMVNPALADDVRRRHAETDLFIQMPLEHDTSVVFPFGGSHHALPGVVTINQPEPYFCRPHRLGFRDRTGFVEHLGVKHGLTDREIPSMVVVDKHQVRYVGD